MTAPEQDVMLQGGIQQSGEWRGQDDLTCYVIPTPRLAKTERVICLWV